MLHGLGEQAARQALRSAAALAVIARRSLVAAACSPGFTLDSCGEGDRSNQIFPMGARGLLSLYRNQLATENALVAGLSTCVKAKGFCSVTCGGRGPGSGRPLYALAPIATTWVRAPAGLLPAAIFSSASYQILIGMSWPAGSRHLRADPLVKGVRQEIMPVSRGEVRALPHFNVRHCRSAEHRFMNVTQDVRRVVKVHPFLDLGRFAQDELLRGRQVRIACAVQRHLRKQRRLRPRADPQLYFHSVESSAGERVIEDNAAERVRHHDQ